MNRTHRIAAAIAVSLIAISSNLVAQSAEHWSGFATVHSQQVPVHLDLSTSSADGPVNGGFVNGKQYSAASRGTLTQRHLTLNFDYFAHKLDGNFEHGIFVGTYGGGHGDPVAIELHEDTSQKQAAAAQGKKKAESVRGNWEIAVKSPKGESAWPLRITPLGHGEIKAIILKVDGDTNALYGFFDAETRTYQVSHFSAAGPALYRLKPQQDGTLLVTNPLHDGQQWTARRPEEARKENLAPPTKNTEQTGAIDPSKPFRFSAPDLNGNVISSTDPQFRGKVVIVAIGGSWCPNCHDEAPFLVDLYHRYHHIFVPRSSLRFTVGICCASVLRRIILCSIIPVAYEAVDVGELQGIIQDIAVKI